MTRVIPELLEPLPLPDPDELVILCERHPSLQEYCVASPTTTEDFARRSSTLESVALARGWAFSIADGDRKIHVRPGIATPSFFRVLAAEPVVGRLFAADEVGEDAWWESSRRASRCRPSGASSSGVPSTSSPATRRGARGAASTSSAASGTAWGWSRPGRT